MELKEFVKGVLTQITDAVKESQEEIKNGAVICPTNYRAQEVEKININGVDYIVSIIDFDINVYTEQVDNISAEINAGVSWLVNVVGKGDYDNENKSGNTTRIKFKIPLVLPSIKTIPPNRPR